MYSKSYRSYTTYINDNNDIKEKTYINLIDNDNDITYLIQKNNNDINEEYHKIYNGNYNNYDIFK